MAFLNKKNIINLLKKLFKHYNELKKDKQIKTRIRQFQSFLQQRKFLYVKNEYLIAKEQYIEAGVEGTYNLIYVNRKLNMFLESLQKLDKLQTIFVYLMFLYQRLHYIRTLFKQSKCLGQIRFVISKTSCINLLQVKEMNNHLQKPILNIIQFQDQIILQFKIQIIEYINIIKQIYLSNLAILYQIVFPENLKNYNYNQMNLYLNQIVVLIYYTFQQMNNQIYPQSQKKE
ncbi:unnamed protein product [Paramecium sonneborni]|uniref:Uncharacterized protein n=1 Tax=Paramecium sonneborni TaxID=65129 RepID=A0A8S1QY02_9CILI|nr:unnamed protein product [Paramecium sonneborni]